MKPDPFHVDPANTRPQHYSTPSVFYDVSRNSYPQGGEPCHEEFHCGADTAWQRAGAPPDPNDLEWNWRRLVADKDLLDNPLLDEPAHLPERRQSDAEA